MPGVQVSFKGMKPPPPESEVRQALFPGFQKALGSIGGSIERKLPDGATGNLRRALTRTIVNTPEGLRGIVFIDDSNPASKYAYYVEYGRMPGRMPDWHEGSQLFKWVQRKVTSEAYRATGKVQRKTPARQKLIEQRAFLIARAIGKHGTKAQHPFQKGFNESYREALQLLEEDSITAVKVIS